MIGIAITAAKAKVPEKDGAPAASGGSGSLHGAICGVMVGMDNIVVEISCWV